MTRLYLVVVVSFSFRESVVSEPFIRVGEDTNIKNTITSERIILSEKIANDCPFFL